MPTYSIAQLEVKSKKKLRFFKDIFTPVSSQFALCVSYDFITSVYAGHT